MNILEPHQNPPKTQFWKKKWSLSTFAFQLFIIDIMANDIHDH